MSKHTPGPWVLGKVGDTGYSEQVAPCHIWTSKGPGHGLVATTNPHCQPTEQNRIDARLIAAAPDLLAALLDAQEELRLIRMKDTDAVYNPCLRVTMGLAIAKATGE